MTVEEIVERGGEADDVLRDVVETLQSRAAPSGPGSRSSRATGSSSALRPAESSPGKLSGTRSSGRAPRWQSCRRPADPERLAQVAALIAPYCLVGWDTGGEPWNP